MSTEEGCPDPNSYSFTTPEEGDQDSVTKREFTISLSTEESTKYLLLIEQNKKNLNLSLQLKEENDNLSTCSYKNSFSLESLKNISKLFRLYDSISEVTYYLFEELENNKQILKLDKNSNMCLIFSYQIPGMRKPDEVILCLEKKNLNNIEMNEVLLKEIIKMKNEIKELKEENEKLKMQLKEQNNNTANLDEIIEKKISQFKNEINNKFIQYENEINNLREKYVKSCPKDDISTFVKLFKEKNPDYKNKNIELKLIYTASKDGQNYANCHSKCNNVPNTFSVITTKKGNKFGFFRSIAIDGQGPWKVDNNAFFISFDKNKIYPVKSNQNSVSFDNCCFIQTKPFVLIGNILTDKYSCCDKSKMNEYFEGFTEDFELNDGERDFYVKEFEVYKLEI